MAHDLYKLTHYGRNATGLTNRDMRAEIDAVLVASRANNSRDGLRRVREAEASAAVAGPSSCGAAA